MHSNCVRRGPSNGHNEPIYDQHDNESRTIHRGFRSGAWTEFRIVSTEIEYANRRTKKTIKQCDCFLVRAGSERFRPEPEAGCGVALFGCHAACFDMRRRDSPIASSTDKLNEREVLARGGQPPGKALTDRLLWRPPIEIPFVD